MSDLINDLRVVVGDDAEAFAQLNDVRIYRQNGVVHGVMGSVIVPTLRTVYSGSVDNVFTKGMLRDLIRYRDESDLCLITDTPSEFDRLRTLLQERYNFICVVEENVIDNKPLMFSFHFKGLV